MDQTVIRMYGDVVEAHGENAEIRVKATFSQQGDTSSEKCHLIIEIPGKKEDGMNRLVELEIDRYQLEKLGEVIIEISRKEEK